MTSVDINHNEAIFPDSHEFKLERWLEKRPEDAPPLGKYMVSFSRGSRMCVGIKYVSSHESMFLLVDKFQSRESRVIPYYRYDFPPI
jgi:cytochrome P450